MIGIRAVSTETEVDRHVQHRGRIDADQQRPRTIPTICPTRACACGSRRNCRSACRPPRPAPGRTSPTSTRRSTSGAPDPLQGGRRYRQRRQPQSAALHVGQLRRQRSNIISRRPASPRLSLFRRDLFGFIQRSDVPTSPIPCLGRSGSTSRSTPARAGSRAPRRRSRPSSTSAGVPDSSRGFGIQANVTYLDAETRLPQCLGRVRSRPASSACRSGPTISPASTSAADCRRGSPTTTGAASSIVATIAATTSISREAFPAGRLDLSVNYNLFENATIFFDWTNILQDPFRVNFSSGRGGAPARGICRASCASTRRPCRWVSASVCDGGDRWMRQGPGDQHLPALLLHRARTDLGCFVKPARLAIRRLGDRSVEADRAIAVES